MALMLAIAVAYVRDRAGGCLLPLPPLLLYTAVCEVECDRECECELLELYRWGCGCTSVAVDAEWLLVCDRWLECPLLCPYTWFCCPYP